MQPEGAILPKFQPARHQPETRPMSRPGNGADTEASGGLADLAFELEAALERARLRRGPGADLAAARPAGEIGIGLLGADRLGGALDADLAAQALPMQA